MARPLLCFGLSYILGIGLAPFLPFSPWPLWLAGLSCLVVAAALYFRDRPESVAVLLILAAILGSFTYHIRQEEVSTSLWQQAGAPLTLQGVVCRDPETGGKGLYLLRVQAVVKGNDGGTGRGAGPAASQGGPGPWQGEISARQEGTGAKATGPGDPRGPSRDRAGEQGGKVLEEARGLVLITVSGTNPSYAYGDLLEVSGTLERPPEPQNPGQFNYRAYLEGQGIYLTMRVKGQGDIRLLGKGEHNPFLSRLLAFKRALVRVNAETLSKDQAALINEMLFGTKGEINRDLRNLFAETGLIHILSVSGLHVGLVLGGVLGLGKTLGLSAGWLSLVAAIVLLAYGAMTGLQPPVVRALVMAGFLLAAKVLGRARDWPTSLVFAAVVILFFSPRALFEAGFQLSFGATWGILFLGPILDRWLFFLPRKLKPLAVIPVAAQLGTGPLVAYYFNLVPLIAIPANILLVELAGFMVYLGFVASLGGILWLPLAGALNVPQGYLADFFLWAAARLAEVPGGVFYLAAPPLWLIFIWYALLLAAGLATSLNSWQLTLRRWWGTLKKPLLVPITLALLLLWGAGWVWPSPGPLQVTFLDVGEGDCALVRTPQGKTLLIDTGGRPAYLRSKGDIGRDTVVPFLRSQGVNKIDTLVLTHGHEDHFGGALAVLRAFPVNLVILSPLWSGEQAYQATIREAGTKGASLVMARAGDRLRLDPEVAAIFLHPQKKLIQGSSSDLNNNSLVLKLFYGHRSFLFVADAETEALQTLLDSGFDLRADVLKVAHHGSKYSYSPEFYRRVSPKLAVISVGKNNFGHPSPEVIRGLSQGGAGVLRTDRHGAITVATDGVKLQVKTVKEDSHGLSGFAK